MLCVGGVGVFVVFVGGGGLCFFIWWVVGVEWCIFV